MELVGLVFAEHLSLPHEEAARDIMDNPDFKEYVRRNGYHFTAKAATMACNMMCSSAGGVHPWSWKEVETAITPYIGGNRNAFTLGDYTYMANMYLMDFYPHIIKEKTDCIKMAVAMADDEDGYKGLPFMRWISDLVGKNIADFSWLNAY